MASVYRRAHEGWWRGSRVENRSPRIFARHARNRGLSQEAVAKKLRLSRSLIAQIELANRPLSVDELAKFADLYGARAVDLMGNTRRG